MDIGGACATDTKGRRLLLKDFSRDLAYEAEMETIGRGMGKEEIKTLQPVIQACTRVRQKTPERQFYMMRQGQATSLVIKGINRPIQFQPITGEGIVVVDDKKLVFENMMDIEGNIRLTAKQLFVALCIRATESNNSNTVKIPLAKYMEMRGLKDKKETRKQVKADLKVLKAIRIEFLEKRRGEFGAYLKINLFGGTEGIMNGVIVFEFSTDFFECLKKYNASPIPEEILKLNQNRNPNSFYFLEKISSHKNMNTGKSNEDVIGVMTLLESTPLIPRYKDIKKQGKVLQRISRPFERDMKAIEGTLKWSYCGTNGVKVTPPKNYMELENTLIKIVWINYPSRKNKPHKNNIEDKKVV